MGFTSTEDDNMQIFCKQVNGFFKRTVLALRLSLKSLDSIIEEIEDHENKDVKRPYDWIIREVIMLHRLF
jgi:hypothetical protein